MTFPASTHTHPDAALAHRSLRSFGELLAALSRDYAGPGAAVRRPHAVGARLEHLGENPFFHAAIVPPGAELPTDDATLPYCLWTLGEPVPGRTEVPELTTPCMGLWLESADFTAATNTALHIETPLLDVLGDLNEHAYGDFGWFSPLVQTLRDERVRTYGVRDGDAFVCVALTIQVDDDLGIHYVATEESHRRRGLASALVRAVLAAAQRQGLRSATLQASADGLPVWQRLGFREVGMMRGFVAPSSGLG